ncbi:MAG: hypothetical protein WA749_10020 [Gelidibacter sp.]
MNCVFSFAVSEKLPFAGKVGTGFYDYFLETWKRKFDKIERNSIPFRDDKNGFIHWLNPQYVAQFEFSESTF